MARQINYRRRRNEDSWGYIGRLIEQGRRARGLDYDVLSDFTGLSVGGVIAAERGWGDHNIGTLLLTCGVAVDCLELSPEEEFVEGVMF